MMNKLCIHSRGYRCIHFDDSNDCWYEDDDNCWDELKKQPKLCEKCDTNVGLYGGFQLESHKKPNPNPLICSDCMHKGGGSCIDVW